MKFDVINAFLEVIKPDNKLFEIRALYGGGKVVSGYFDCITTAVECLKDYSFPNNSNIYFTLNNINDKCKERKQFNKFVSGAKPTTSDNDINYYEWLPIDVDPVRPTNVSSTSDELLLARHKAHEVRNFMYANGFSDPIVAMSGNGYHLLYLIGFENSRENATLVSNCLKVLSMLFSDKHINIDVKTSNPSRIFKLYGTKSCKGDNTEERPHRMSEVLKIPDNIIQNKKHLLEELASLMPEPEVKINNFRNGYNNKQFNIHEFMAKHLRVKQEITASGYTKYILEHCPFNPEHKGKDSMVTINDNGAIGFFCFHNSCANNKWQQLRAMYEPNFSDKKYVKLNFGSNSNNENHTSPKIVNQKIVQDVNDEPVFYTMQQIEELVTPPDEYIKTGTDVIDTKMGGLAKGCVTCITGLRGSGKSTWIGQLAIESAEQGYRTAIFSGELKTKKISSWLKLQSAGKYHVNPTQYDNFFTVKDEVNQKIVDWLNNKIYVYNNAHGNDFAKIFDRLAECVEKYKVDFIILDNLMALDISMLEKEIYRQQSMFVQTLMDYSKLSNVHTLFVAHPRKPLGFLRLDDVGGSGDITNRVDNAFIVHRVNDDFKRLSHAMYKWEKNNDLYSATNVIEICKDREMGTMDTFIPLYYCNQGKRLKNYEHEHKRYGWEDSEFYEVYEKIKLPFLDD